MPRLFVLDVPENEGFINVAAQEPANEIDHVGPYWRISAQTTIVIDRRASGCRHAVWYSSVAGLEGAMITQYDQHVLRVEQR